MKSAQRDYPDILHSYKQNPTLVLEPHTQHEDRLQKIHEILPHLRDLPTNAKRPPGSFDIFGYGSIIFKPPPHVISYTPGYIQGFVRRFALHSEDHRGTPERPGRVVTLVSADHWHSLPGADDAPEGDIVWGISYTIDPAHADEVRAYLDNREKIGYTPMWAPIFGYHGMSEEPQVLVPEALVYVGLPDHEAFVGPQPLDELAERIHTCHGPSGPNHEYLLRLAEAVRILTPKSKDIHLFSLEEKVLALKAKDIPLPPRNQRRKLKVYLPTCHDQSDKLLCSIFVHQRKISSRLL
ncbi:Similar to S.cerevisiae protein GCG1 (Gamma-glutamyl cyclotransferase) [Malassezia sympodialis ATCC 42132]|uniref:glutathione-specific gamma-glutamylcyclotransferase n=1 Tax=Malassezia sympodialis (strain ATCC 42132) TaxID=1230383 RepID=A0A1M7ZZU0_MALS4|nr:Similar to S.cerevisiae protein GCG1 (Gamma-glutamyl cyclotransferase) [Malassezia sympodialis ATCC 42132]